MSGGPPGTGAGWDAGYQPGLLRDLWEAIPPRYCSGTVSALK